MDLVTKKFDAIYLKIEEILGKGPQGAFESAEPLFFEANLIRKMADFDLPDIEIATA